MYRTGSDMQLGLEYNPRAGQVGPLVNLRLLREHRDRPALTFGVSSDRIGTPQGEAYYLTLSKGLHRQTGLPISPYVAVLYGEFDNKVIYPFGVNLRLGRGWSGFMSNDGHATHLMTTYAWKRYSLTFLMVRTRDPGVTFSVGF